MIKKFHIQIPLALKDSFDLLGKSGDDIASWQIHDSNFENGNISMYDMIQSVEGLIDGIISNKNEDGSLEAGLIQTESDGYLKEILEKCKELKKQKTVIINGGETTSAKGFSD